MLIEDGLIFLYTKVLTYKDLFISDCLQFYRVFEWQSVNSLSFASVTVVCQRPVAAL